MNKRYEELQFTDDFMFCKVLSNNLPLCAEVISLILGIRIREVKLAESQKAIEIKADGRGIRLDVYVEDEAHTVFDLEMQTTFQADLAKRSRYYQGMIDLNLIQRGAWFGALKKSCVIFICTFDAFGKDIPVYTFENVCRECPDVTLNDETRKVFVNAASTDSGMSDEMRQFIRFLANGTGQSQLVSRLREEVDKARTQEEWRVEYMTLFLRDQQMRDEGRAEGRAEGLAEGRAEGLARELKTLCELVNDGYLPVSVAAQKCDKNEEEFRKDAAASGITLSV